MGSMCVWRPDSPDRIGRPFSRTLVALTLAAAVLPPAAIAAQSVKLNGPLAQPLAGDVTDYAISPDGARVVYRADQAFDEVFELFSAPIDGSAAAVRLHAALPEASQDVGAFAIGAGGRVVFLADLGIDGETELFSAPIDGSASPVALSGDLPAAGDVVDFLLTPDGTRAVYRADSTVDDTLELHSVAVDGSSPPVQLDPQHRPCTLYRSSASSSFALFAYFDDFVQELLYRVPLDASQAPVLVANSGPPGIISFTRFDDLQISPDDLNAAFLAAEVFLDGTCGECEFHVWGLSLSGPTQTELTENSIFTKPLMTLAGGHVLYEEAVGFGSDSLYTIETDGTDRVLLTTNVSEFAVSPDESLVVFVSGSGVSETLRIAPVDGSAAPTALAGPGSLASPRVTTSSTLVVFIGTDPSTSFRGLWAVPTTGGAPLLLNGPTVPGGFGAVDFTISPQGPVVVYREDRAADERFELWSVDTSVEPRNLSGSLVGFQDVLSYQISLDGQRVVHLADRNSNDSDDLFGTAIDSGDPLVQYNESSLPGGPVLGDVTSFVASPDETHVLYRADQDSDEFFELYSVQSGGSEAPVRLTGSLSEAGDVQGFAYTPAGDRALFAFGLFPQVLHSAPTSGAGPVVALDTAANGFLGPFAFPGTDVVYGRLGPPGSTLHRTALDGSQPPITLADPPTGSVQQFQLTPDTLTVIYQGGVPTELYSVPSDGSAAPVRINAPLVTNGSVETFRVSPDSSRVVYRADQDVDFKAELYVVPSDGSASAVKLNGAMPAGGDVTEFAITADAARVVYRADQTIDGRPELYGVPIDASAPSVRLTPLLNNRQVATDFVLGSWNAYYRADPAAVGRFELFRVAVDGSALPQQLSAPVGTNGDVNAFALSPDGSRVVYLADARLDEVFELFSVPAAGGTVLPLVTLPATGDVTTFRIEPQSAFVVYLADANVDGVPELFRVPLDASKPPHRLHPNLPPGGQVQPDFVPLSGGDALYRADRESDDVFELYRAFRIDLDDKDLPFPAPTRSASTVR